MLAPSYHRQPTKRQRGISLSRTSSQHKLYQSTNDRIISNLNQSFQCHQPKSHAAFQQNNFNNSTALKQNNQNRLNLMPYKYKSCRQQKSRNTGANSHYRNRSILQASTKQNLPTDPQYNQNDSLWQQAQSIGQMIDLLSEYEKTCQRQMDLQSAEQARKRINQLKIESINTKRKQLQVEGKQYIVKTRRQGQLQKQQFYQFWNDKILQAKKALKQIEQKHLQQQQKQLYQFEQCIQSQTLPLTKYSSKVLQIRRNLSSLIKSRKYKQAEHLKQLLAKREYEQNEKWVLVCQQKKLHRIRQYKRKLQIDLQAFRMKLNSSFNELIKQKQKQQQRMNKKMKKMQVQASKIPSSIIKAKKQLLNQSKANIQNSDY